ncbi:MAG: hypothetical protein GX757_04270 [Clostridiales bacterium]|nr:hypothetical protein [Clostridiales bacterium]
MKHIVFSITHQLAKYIISKESWIRETFKYTTCADEIFLQTIAYNSGFASNIINDNLRFIDWKRGSNSSPYIFRISDYNELINSKSLFARKFNEINYDNK